MPAGGAESRLRTVTHDVASAFIAEQRPSEALMFPAIWEQFLLDLSRQQETPHRETLHDAGLAFDDEHQSFLATPFVILTVWAVLRELDARDLRPAQTAINAAIRSSAKALGTPKILIEELVQVAGAKLAETLGQLDVPAPKSGGHPWAEQLPNEYVVEWLAMGEGDGSEPVKPERGSFSESQVDQRFRRTRRDYVLYVDESVPQMFSSQQNRELWHEMRAQHRAFLHEFLKALRRGFVSYDDLYESVFAESASEVDYLASARSRIKSELDAILGGVLKEHLRAAKGQYRYEIRGRLPYCWIRRADSVSLLRLPKP